MAQPYVRQPYRQRTRSWPNEQIFTLDNFGGGLNNVDPENIIADNEFTDTKNMRFIGNTLVQKRQGTKLVDESKFLKLDEPIVWVDEYSPLLGQSRFVYATETKFYVDGAYVCAVNGKIQGVSYNGKYYFVDGTALYVYDGADWYKVTTEPYTYLAKDVISTDTTIVVESIPEQVVVGDKVWFTSGILDGFTDEDSYGISKTISSIDVSTNTITLDSAVGYAIDAAYEEFKSPVSFYEPSDKTFGDEVWDTEAHLAYYLPCRYELTDSYAGNSYIPSSPEIITVHSNRLFVSGDEQSPNAAYMSGLSTIAPQPLYFPASASVSVKSNGKKIVDMVVFDNALIIGRNEDLFVLYGDTPYPSSIASSGTQFYLKQLDATTGFMNTNCGALINNYYIYLGYDGRFYALNTPTTYVEYLMTKPLDFKCNVYNTPFSFTRNTTLELSTVAYRNEVLFAIGDYVIVYNYDNMAYTYYTGWDAKCLFTNGNTLFFGNKNGYFARWCDEDDSVYNDLGYAISAVLCTKQYDLNMSAVYKYFKRFMLTSNAYETMNSYIQVEFEVDYYRKSDTDDYIINSNTGRFGISEWGYAVFGNQDILKSGWRELDIRGRTIKFTFTNENLNEPMLIYDLNVIWSIRDVR